MPRIKFLNAGADSPQNVDSYLFKIKKVIHQQFVITSLSFAKKTYFFVSGNSNFLQCRNIHSSHGIITTCDCFRIFFRKCDYSFFFSRNYGRIFFIAPETSEMLFSRPPQTRKEREKICVCVSGWRLKTIGILLFTFISNSFIAREEVGKGK